MVRHKHKHLRRSQTLAALSPVAARPGEKDLISPETVYGTKN